MVRFAPLSRYVLKHGLQPMVLLETESANHDQVKAIFGFSDKPQYDLFISQSDLPLMPYPLVKYYLKTQIEHEPDALKLVVIDASIAEQLIHYSATFQAVLEAMNRDHDTVEISHELILDEHSRVYRIHSRSQICDEKIAH